MDPAYLSILQWPDGLAEDGKIEALVAAAAMDVDQARLRVRRGVPQVFARIDGAHAPLVLDELHRRGVLAFAPTQRQLRSVPEPVRVKRLIPRHEGCGFVCEAWRGEGDAFAFDEIFLILHAGVRQITRTTTSQPPSTWATLGGYSAAGMAGAFAAAYLTQGSPEVSTRMQASEVVDLYRRDGSRLRLDTSKLSFCVLEEDRGLSDRENIAELVDRLRRRMPEALYDQGFGGFICPPDVLTSGLRSAGSTTVARSDTAPLLEFYSTWAFCMYRHLLG